MFVENVTHFARVLRRAGVPVGPDRVIAALEAIEAVGFSHRDDVHAALSAVMLDRHEQQDVFDQAFDAFLLEVLAENQLTIPELGTIKASAPPIVIITSNRTRDIHDALKRRCLYHWVGYPDAVREMEIVRLRAPGAAERLYAELQAAGLDVLFDDRDETPGVKFNDADLLGIPLRVTVSKIGRAHV